MKLKGKVIIDLEEFHILDPRAALSIVGREVPLTFNGQPFGTGVVTGLEHVDGVWWIFFDAESPETWDKVTVNFVLPPQNGR